MNTFVLGAAMTFLQADGHLATTPAFGAAKSMRVWNG
jgi:hypothetical protein